jgi:putative phage-type endonuclease
MHPQAGLTDEQHAVRAQGIGGSDIAALLGLDPYRGPWDVWASKTGRAEPTPETRFTRWGNRLEAVIADEYAERFGVSLLQHTTMVHPRRPWHLGTPDRLVPGHGEWMWGVEIKARGLRQAWKWGTEDQGAAGVPDEVAAQAHWYMALTELPRWDVAVLLDGNDFRTYRLERDEETEAAMLDVGARFWRDHVQANVAPAFDGGDAAWAYLRERLAGAEQRAVSPTAEVEAMVRSLEHAIGAIEHAEQRKAELRQRLTDLAADLGVRGFACDEWRFTAVEQRGRVNYKTAFAAACARAGIGEDARRLIEEGSRGRAFIAPRFTSKRLKEEAED